MSPTRHFTGFLVALLVALSPSVASTAEPAAPRQGDLQFRRVFVPADRPEQWPLDGEPYVPVAREELERYLQAANRTEADNPEAGQPAIAVARYTANFDGQDLSGTAQWQLIRLSAAQQYLNVSTNLAIDQPSWQLSDDTPAPRPVFGTTNHGTQVLLVPRSATLAFGWSLRANSASSDDVTFDLQLPRSTASSLRLRLPDPWVPTAPGAVVVKQQVDDSRAVWLLELGSKTNVSLTLRRGTVATTPGELPRVREQLNYDISQRGLELTAELEFLDLDQEQSEIAVSVDPEMAVLMVEVDGVATPWSRVDEEAPGVVRIRPAKPLRKKSVMRLSALAPIVMDQHWRVPGVRALGVEPQEGTLICRVLSPLVLNDVQAESCRQVSAGLLALPLSGELLEFETYASDRALDVSLGLQAPIESFTSATTLTVSQDDLLASSHYRARLRDGQLFRLTGELAPGWVIESVEAVGGTEITNWVVDRADTPAKLRIAVESSLRGGQWLELSIAARKLDWLMDKATPLAELIPLRFVADGPRTDWVAFELPTDMHLRFSDGAAPAAVEPDAMVEQLFGRSKPLANVLRVDDRTGKRSLLLERDRPGFAAQIEHVARVAEKRLAETYSIACVPAGALIDRLRLEFPVGSDATLEWPTQTVEGSPLSATRVEHADREIWDVLLAKPQADPFSLRLARSRPFAESTDLALASVANAKAQQIRVQIEAPETLSLDIRPRGMRPVPSRNGTRDSAMRAEYEYQTGAPHPSQPAALTIAPGSDAGPALLVVWNASLVAQYDADGRVVEQAHYFIESHGAQLLALSLAHQQQVVSATVDGQHVAAVLRAQRVEIPLPSRQRFCVVTLTLRSRESAWGLLHRITPELPTPQGSVHVVRRDLRLAIPAAYVMPGFTDAAAPPPQPNIAQRLFGALGSSLSSNSIDSLLRGQHPDAEQRSEQLLLLALGRAAFGRERASSWGDALHRCSADIARQDGRTLYVDHPAVASLNIGSDTPLPSNVGGSSLVEQARTLLDRTGLALVAHNEIVVVTRQGFEQRINNLRLHAGAADGVLTTPADWTRATGHPWSHVAADFPLESNDAWNVYHLALPPGERRPLGLVNADAIALAGWLVLIGTAAIGAWGLKGRWDALLIVLSIASVIALLAPAIFVPISSALVLGLLLAMLAEFVRLAPRAAPPDTGNVDADSRRSSYSRAMSTAGLLVALLITGSHGSEPLGDQRTYQVIVPVDEKQQPVGKQVYVPLEFWQALRARDATASVDWILCDARYQGEVKWDSGRQRLVLPALTADFRLHVLQPGTTVRLPLSVESTLSHWNLHLDGQLVDARFDRAEQAVTFAVTEAGVHHLQLRFAPLVQYSPQRARLETPIAAMPTAKADLVIPAELPPVEFVARRGTSNIDEQGRRIITQLGDVERLAIEWTTSASPTLDDFLPDVDQLLWLRARPGAVTIEAKFSFARPAGMSTFEILADQDLRYIPPDTQGQPAAEIQAIDESQQILVFALPPDEAGPTHVRARFLIPDRLGLGHITLPRVEARTGHARRRWLAVSLDPALALDETRTGAVPSSDEFLAAWGRSDARPDRTYVLSDSAERWSATLQPVEMRISGTDALDVTVGQERIDVQYQAAIEVSSARTFQHRLQVPAELRIEKISVIHADTDQVARWRKDASGAVVVFLRDLPDGAQTLQLRGWLDAPREGAVELPAVQLVDARLQSTNVRIARRSDTLLELADTNLTAVTASSGAAPKDEQAFVVGYFLCESGPPRGELRLRANTPRTQATLVTRLARDGSGWKALVDCDLHVSQGAVDALRFSLPGWWQGPFSVASPATMQTRHDSNDNQELVVQFAQPVETSHQFRWEAPLPSGEAELRFPSIKLNINGELVQYLALPTREASRWQLAGVRRADPPAFITAAPDSERLTYYRCVDPNFSVAAAPRTQQQHVEVLYQSIELFFDTPRHGYGVATIDLAPRGQLDAVLQLPAQCALLQVLLDDEPAVVAPAEHERWRVLLHSDAQIQRLRVLYTQTPSANKPQQTLATPVVEADRQPEFVWRVQSTVPLEWRTDERISSAEFARLALAQCSEMFDKVSLGQDSPQTQMVAQRWWARVQQAQHALQRTNPALAAESRHAIEDQQKSLQPLEPPATGTSQRPLTGLPASSESLAPLAALELSGRPIFAGGFLSSDATATAPLLLTSAESNIWRRALLALAIVVATLTWRRYSLGEVVRALLYRWPWLLPAAVGVTWWLLMSPSILGALLVALAVGYAAATWLRPRLQSSRRWSTFRRESDSRFA